MMYSWWGYLRCHSRLNKYSCDFVSCLHLWVFPNRLWQRWVIIGKTLSDAHLSQRSLDFIWTSLITTWGTAECNKTTTNSQTSTWHVLTIRKARVWSREAKDINRWHFEDMIALNPFNIFFFFSELYYGHDSWFYTLIVNEWVINTIWRMKRLTEK